MEHYGGTFPDNVLRFLKRNEVDSFRASLIKLCKGRTGAIVVHGEDGVGKTTLVSHVIKGLTSHEKADCRLQQAIWLNVYEMTSARNFDEAAFYSLLLSELLNSDSHTAQLKPDLKTLRNAITKNGKRLLLVLDDVNSPGVIRCVSHLGDLVRCIAITNDRRKASLKNCTRFPCEAFQIQKLSHLSLGAMLGDLFKLKALGLDEDQIGRLVDFCHGLPIIASLIEAHFRTQQGEPKEIFDNLIHDLEEATSEDEEPDEQNIVSKLVSFSDAFESGQFRDAFLLFPPRQPVCVADLAILWKTTPADVNERCQEAVVTNLLATSGREAKTGHTHYFLHDLVFKAAVERAFGDSPETRSNLDQLRRSILENSLSQPGSNILAEATKTWRVKLLELIAAKSLQPELVAKLCFSEKVLIALAEFAVTKRWLRNEGLPNERSISGEIFCRLADSVAQHDFERCLNDFRSAKNNAGKTVFDYIAKSMQNKAGEPLRKMHENLFLTAARLGCGHLIDLIIAERMTADLVAASTDDQGNNALITASRYGWSHLVKALIESGLIDVNAKNRRGWTALMCCSSHANCLHVAKELNASHQLDATICDSNGDTALLLATINERRLLAKFLVDECEADPTWTNKAGLNALDEAANRGFIEASKFLISKGVGMGKSSHKSALEYATRTGNNELHKLLTSQKDTLLKNKRKTKGKSAPIVEEEPAPPAPGKLSCRRVSKIHELAELGLSDGIREALGTEQGQDELDIPDDEGNTALIIACYFDNADAAKLLLANGAKVDAENGEGCTALNFACQNGHEDVAKVLLDNGANVEARNQKGNTALIVSCQGGHFSVAKLLLECGAKVNEQNGAGNTALSEACSTGHADVTELLLEHGASIDMQNVQGCTALIHAAADGRLDVAKLLVERGANVELENEMGNTALIASCQNGHFHVAKLLLDNGASINAQNYQCRTALMAASIHCHVELIENLLVSEDYFCDVDIQDVEGKTALFWACECGHTDVAKALLEQSGAGVNLRSTKGRTALSAAKARHNSGLVELLIRHGGKGADTTTSGKRCALM